MRFLSILIGLIFCCSLLSCESIQTKKNIKLAKEFYEIYSERKDVNKLMSYYSFSSQYIDAVPQINLEGIQDIKNQYNWSDSLYKRDPHYPKAVNINSIVANDSIAVVSGEYNPYYYNNKHVNSMKFTSWLYFDKEGKIMRQVEWVQYPIEVLEEIISIKKHMSIQNHE